MRKQVTEWSSYVTINCNERWIVRGAVNSCRDLINTMRGFDFDISEVKKAEGMDGRPNLQLISSLNFILTTMNAKGLLADLLKKKNKTKQNMLTHNRN